jgi:hypothetical protein
MPTIRFDSVIQAFDDYRTSLPPAPESIRYLGEEAQKRMLQLDWILRRIAQVDQELQVLAQELPSGPGPAVPLPEGYARRALALIEETELFAEAFYYFAWRLRQVLRSLPGFKDFESIGVRNCRNHLVEHPEKKRGRLYNSFASNSLVGPVLKPSRPVNDTETYEDPGLFINAAELQGNILGILQAARKAPTPP